MSDGEQEKICCLCGHEYIGFGNNPEPLREASLRCCDVCNSTKVIPVRIRFFENRKMDS